MKPGFTIKALEKPHSDQALALVANEFSTGSPLHKAMGITQQEYFKYLSLNWDAYAFDGPVSSLGAFCNLNDELIGCLIAARFPVCFDEIDTLPEKHQPIAALLQTLEQHYLTNNNNSHGLLVDLAIVKSSHRGAGIYKNLRTTLHSVAASAGYNTVFGELSSSVTQHICINKMQHQVVAEITYRNFSYDGETPFATIDDPHSIQLVRTSV